MQLPPRTLPVWGYFADNNVFKEFARNQRSFRMQLSDHIDLTDRSSRDANNHNWLWHASIEQMMGTYTNGSTTNYAQILAR